MLGQAIKTAGLLKRVHSVQPLVVTPARGWIKQAPPRNPFSTFDYILSLGVFGFAVLTPMGWILAHLDDYRGGPAEVKNIEK